ncbi:MAG: type I restriction endonuclease subunit R [Pyrobaculum sp.]|jgi:type I restriction enzyme R subunit
MSEVHTADQFLNRLEELGWRFVKGRCPSRGVTVSDPILDRVFDESFRRLNRRVLEAEGLGDRVDAVLTKVRDLLRKSEPYEVLEFLRRGVYVREGGKSVRVFLIDYENVENNEFLACPEVSFPGEGGRVRPDVVLYVNGIPLVVVEVKDPLRLGERAIEEGYNQLRRYERQYPELFKYVQVGVVYTDEVGSVYMPMSSVLGGGDRWYGRWRDEAGKYDIFGLLDRARFLEVLRWFVFYKGQRKDQKVVPRYNQYWATYKAVKRAREYLLGDDYRNRGLIWHWQGSGKTYIMFYIAYQFFHRFLERDPLVFFVVDRRELQRQLYDEFIKDLYAPYFQEYVKIVESIDELKYILRDIAEREASGRAAGRGVFIVLVQKFRPDEFKDVKPIKKKEVLILLDEAHRSVYGVLGATLNRLFPNAVKFAFTGTPVMRYERNTFEYFSYPREELYLDKYFIADSIKDGYTVPLRYQVVQEIGDLRINVSEREIQELLEKWVNIVGEVSSLDDAVEEGITVEEIRHRLNRIKVFLENPERLRRIAEYIAERIEEDTEAFRFKAIVVTASRLACVRMKRALDEALSRRFGEEAKKWSEVVMTYTNNDPEEIQSYMEEMLKRWRGPEGLRAWEEANWRIQERFKDGEDPRILIVTDMLITGFDFPRLKVMYLDKPLFEHRLLQAIARVNRPYRSGDVEKQFGLVIDFVGLLEHVKEALARYEMLDSETLSDLFETSINRVDETLRQLDALIKDIKQRLLSGVRIGVHEVKIDIDSLVIRLSDEDVYEELRQAALLLAMGFDSDVNVSRLVSDMRRAFSLYRALGAYPEKEKVRADIAILHKLYMGIMYHVKGLRLPNGFWSDLINLIHKKTIIPEIEVVDEVTLEPSIFDELLRRIEMIRDFSHSPKEVYAAGEVLLALKGSLRDKLSNPVYRVIYERLKELEEEWRSSRPVSLAMINRLKELLSELARYERERREKSLPERLVYDVKEFIYRQYKIHVEKLVNTEQVLQKIVNRYVSVPVSTFYEQDRKELRTALLKDLFKILSMKEDEVQQIAHALADYIESEVVYELRRNR